MSEILQTDRFTCSYDISRKIDRGRFGHVFLCRHKQSMMEYAVKFVSETKMAAIYVLREAAICLRLEHRNIVKLVELYKDMDKRLFLLVFEMAWQGKLYDDIVKGRYSEVEASHCLEQILQGVDHIHRNEFVHRDLTPDNILLTNSKFCTVVKIADFGSAMALSEGGVFNYQEDRESTGCFGYCLAPEMRRGEFCSHSVDLWACGAILYLMIYGMPPYSGKGDELLNQMLNKGLDDGGIRGVSEDAKNLICQFLNLNGENRPPAESALTHPFILSHRTVRSRFHHYHIDAKPTSYMTYEASSTFVTATLDNASQNTIKETNELRANLGGKTSSVVVKESHAGEKERASPVGSPQVKKRRSSSCLSKPPTKSASTTPNKEQHIFLKPTRRSARKVVRSRMWKHKSDGSQNCAE